MGDHFEIWYFPIDVDNEQIQEWYNMFDEFDHDAADFEDYMQMYHKDIDCHKVYTEEIWV